MHFVASGPKAGVVVHQLQLAAIAVAAYREIAGGGSFHIAQCLPALVGPIQTGVQTGGPEYPKEHILHQPGGHQVLAVFQRAALIGLVGTRA